MTVNKGKISAIIPVYNAEKYLAQAIESIIAQSYISWEMFLVASESEDRSVEIAEKYSREYDNIYLIITEERGIGCARNRGLEKSTGEYILFMDADDIFRTGRFFKDILILLTKLIQILLSVIMHVCGTKNFFRPLVTVNFRGLRGIQKSSVFGDFFP